MSDWFTSSILSYDDVFINAGLKVILLFGKTFIIGRKGSEFGLKEWPTHLTTPQIGGKTYVASTFYLTFDWIVWLSFTFLKSVLSGLDFNSLY